MFAAKSSVTGSPSSPTAHPSGIGSSFFASALIFPWPTWLVAMSRTSGTPGVSKVGTPKAVGLVAYRRSTLPAGATLSVLPLRRDLEQPEETGLGGSLRSLPDATEMGYIAPPDGPVKSKPSTDLSELVVPVDHGRHWRLSYDCRCRVGVDHVEVLGRVNILRDAEHSVAMVPVQISPDYSNLRKYLLISLTRSPRINERWRSPTVWIQRLPEFTIDSLRPAPRPPERTPRLRVSPSRPTRAVRARPRTRVRE